MRENKKLEGVSKKFAFMGVFCKSLKDGGRLSEVFPENN
jgi:hypothetical protein